MICGKRHRHLRSYLRLNAYTLHEIRWENYIRQKYPVVFFDIIIFKALDSPQIEFNYRLIFIRNKDDNIGQRGLCEKDIIDKINILYNRHSIDVSIFFSISGSSQ